LAFAGTFHAHESFAQCESTFADSKAGTMPEMLPIEMYCHTLTDPSILSTELQEQGYQTLTLFGLHTPAALFDANNEEAKAAALKAALASLNQYLVEPIENVIAAIEVKSPLDIEGDVGLPRGNIFLSVKTTSKHVGAWKQMIPASLSVAQELFVAVA
jgi:phytoene dehydrogenase-like protein